MIVTGLPSELVMPNTKLTWSPALHKSVIDESRSKIKRFVLPSRVVPEAWAKLVLFFSESGVNTGVIISGSQILHGVVNSKSLFAWVETDFSSGLFARYTLTFEAEAVSATIATV